MQLLSLLLFGVVSGVVIPTEKPVTRGGVAFLDQGKFVLTNAKWTMVFDLPIEDLITQLQSLRRQVTHLHNSRAWMKPQDVFMLPILAHEGVSLEAAAKQLETEIESFNWIVPPRKFKRGLINVGGKALKFLFGVADESDLQHVNGRIDALWKGVDQSLHLQEDQITYLNHTIVKMAEIKLYVEHLSTVILSIDNAKKM